MINDKIEVAQGYQYKGRFYATHDEAVWRKVRDEFIERAKPMEFSCGHKRLNAGELMYIIDRNRDIIKDYLEITEGLAQLKEK